MLINKTIKTVEELEDEFDNILNQEPSTDKNVISVYDLTQYQREKRTNFWLADDFIYSKFVEICHEKNSKIKDNTMDYNIGALRLEYNTSNGIDVNIYLKKDRQGNIRVINYDTKDHSLLVKKELEAQIALHEALVTYKEEYPDMKKSIIKTYNDYMKNMKNYKKLNYPHHYMNAINSKLIVGFNFDGVSILAKEEKTGKTKFELQSNTVYPKDLYEDDITNYTYIYGEFYTKYENMEANIFKNTYVEIRHCPKWAQKDLFKIRKESLVSTNEKRKVR